MVVLQHILCPREGIDLIICAILLFDRQIIILPVERNVVDTVQYLLFLSCPQDVRQRIAKVHGSDFPRLGETDFSFLPDSIITHAAANCQILFFEGVVYHIVTGTLLIFAIQGRISIS